MLDVFDGVTTIFGLFLVGAIVATFSAGIAFWLSVADSPMLARKRAMLGSIIASGTLTLIPSVAILLESPFEPETIVAIVALVVGGLFLAAVFGFPVAYWVSNRADQRRVDTSDFE